MIATDEALLGKQNQGPPLVGALGRGVQPPGEYNGAMPRHGGVVFVVRGR